MPDPTDAKDGCRGSNPKGAGAADRSRCRRCAGGDDHGRPGPLVHDGNATSIRWRHAAIAAAGAIGIAAILFLAALAPPARAQADRALQGIISKIRFEGNTTISPEKIKPKFLTRVGQPLDAQKFDADLKTLWRTNWFSNVEVFYDESPPKSGKLIVTLPRQGDAGPHPRRVPGSARRSARRRSRRRPG